MLCQLFDSTSTYPEARAVHEVQSFRLLLNPYQHPRAWLLLDHQHLRLELKPAEGMFMWKRLLDRTEFHEDAIELSTVLGPVHSP